MQWRFRSSRKKLQRDKQKSLQEPFEATVLNFLGISLMLTCLSRVGGDMRLSLHVPVDIVAGSLVS